MIGNADNVRRAEAVAHFSALCLDDQTAQTVGLGNGERAARQIGLHFVTVRLKKRRRRRAVPVWHVIENDRRDQHVAVFI